MNYDKMSVEELLPLYNWNIINATLGKITEDVAGRKGFELFTAIKKAAIREASVGTCYQLDTDISHAVLGNVPEGKYDLIPKETP